MTVTLEILVGAINKLIGTIELALGGIFGLYLIFFIIRAIRHRQEVQIQKDILAELKKLNRNK